MGEQNLVQPEKNDEKGSSKPDLEKKTVYTCGFCGKPFESKLGLKKHLPKCEASPDEPEPEEKEDEGMRIFDDDEQDEKRDTDDDYECGHCGFIMPKPYKRCPDCGEELVWG